MKTRFIILFLILGFLMGCEEDDTIDNPTNTLEADAGTIEGPVFVGDLISLDGSNSKDSKGQDFEFQWSFKSKPQQSQSDLIDDDTDKPSFTPEIKGIYLVELKIYNDDFSDTSELSIAVADKQNPPNDQTVVIDEDINEDTHLFNIFEDDSEIDYLVTKDIIVRSLLTIDPSVTIAFEMGTGMFIENPGVLKSLGIHSGPVVFTGKNKTPGYWKGLIINSDHDTNLLDYTTVEYGGGTIIPGLNAAANILLDESNNANVTLKNSRVQFSASYGLYIPSGTQIHSAHANYINQNQKPASIAASQLGFIDGLIEFDENTNNIIEVTGDRVFSSLPSNWINPPAYAGHVAYHTPYLIKGKIEIASEVNMYEGISFLMDKDAEIVVTSSGSLTAVGTETYPIQFKSSLPNPGAYWKGISILSNSQKNRIEHVEILGAGSMVMDNFVSKTAIGVNGESQAYLKIAETKIVESDGNGILVELNASIGNLSFIKFINNQGSAISLPANEVSKLNDAVALEFTGNGHDGVEIINSMLLDFSAPEIVWPALHFGATYFVSGNLAIQSGLKIMPGATFKMAEDAMIRIFTNGYLKAEGNVTQPITFAGMTETKGFWNGIFFQSSSVENKFNFVHVKHAGKTTMLGINQIASIGLDGDYLSRLTIANSIISAGYGYGIALEDNRATLNDDAESSNQFEDLSLGNIFK